MFVETTSIKLGNIVRLRLKNTTTGKKIWTVPFRSTQMKAKFLCRGVKTVARVCAVETRERQVHLRVWYDSPFLPTPRSNMSQNDVIKLAVAEAQQQELFNTEKIIYG